MIRNVVLHVTNEQPLIADLYAIPTPADAGLLCTNLRMMDGKRPIFIDSSVATFFFPYRVIRFLEIPPVAHGAARGATPARRPGCGARTARRATGGRELPEAERLPVVVGGPARPRRGSYDLDIDEGFLQRIRDI